MRIKTSIAALTAGVALVAVPAYGAGEQPSTTPPGYDGTTNPGTTYEPTSVPPSYDGTTNPGTTQVQTNAGANDTNEPTNPHALAVQQCAQYKTNFKENRSAFGRCVAAVQTTLKGTSSPSQACRSKRLSKTRHDGQARSDYRACVLAATKALHVSG